MGVDTTKQAIINMEFNVKKSLQQYLPSASL